MNKILLLFFLLFISSSTLLANPNENKIAILNTINKAKLEKETVDFLNQMIHKVFAKYLKDSYQILGREEIQTILDNSPPINVENCIEECEVETGVLIKAKFVLASTISKKASTYSFNVKIFDTQSKKILNSKKLQAEKIDDIESLFLTQIKDIIDQ